VTALGGCGSGRSGDGDGGVALGPVTVAGAVAAGTHSRGPSFMCNALHSRDDASDVCLGLGALPLSQIAQHWTHDSHIKGLWASIPGVLSLGRGKVDLSLGSPQDSILLRPCPSLAGAVPE